MRRPFVHLTTLLLIAASGSGCSLWHTVGREGAAAFIAHEKPEVIRVTLADSTLVLKHPTVQGESVVGVVKGTRPTQERNIAVGEIRKLEARTRNGPRGGKTVLAVMGTVSAAFLVLVVVGATQHHGIP